LELLYLAYFTEKEKKGQKIIKCILILDTLKFLIQLAWEAKLISHQQYEEIALKLDEVGKMLGGWKRSLENPKKTALFRRGEENTFGDKRQTRSRDSTHSSASPNCHSTTGRRHSDPA
jgi:hypothetical protein